MPEMVDNIGFDDNSMVIKLELLFVFDKMGIALTENTIIEICATKNNWISYMETIECVNDLTDSGFLYKTSAQSKADYYTLTGTGHECLNNFYSRIPLSRRNEISRYIKQNRMEFKRAQEYSHTYLQNEDGTYTVVLKILEPTKTIMELKINVANRKTAKSVANKWESCAPDVYSYIFEKMID